LAIDFVIVLGQADPPLAGGTRCPQRVGKVNAAVPPKFDIEQRFAGNARRRSSAFGAWF
jgi:hypothetical protein